MKETYVIHVTKECNCNCRYCYETDKSSTYTWEEIRQLLDSIAENATGLFDVEFLGGEPCLELDLVEKCIDYIDADFYTITTNGTIVNDKLIELLRKPNVVWAASLDGHHLANSLRTFKNGHNTCQTVIDNYRKLTEAGIDNNRLMVHMVTHHYNIGYLVDSVRFMYDTGIRRIGIGTVESVMNIDKDYCDTFQEKTQELARLCRTGAFPGLQISEFAHIKPVTDVRTYMTDDSGRMVGESYGRLPGDITERPPEGVNVERVSSPYESTIYGLRKNAHDYHRDFIRYYGCGTGRNASKTLTLWLQGHLAQHSVIHEPLSLPWGFTEEGYKLITNIDAGIVQSTILCYAEALITRGNCSVICIERRKEDFIQSFLRAQRMERTDRWNMVPNVHQYPEFEGTAEAGLEHYWTVYNDEALRLSKKYEDNFSFWSFDQFTKVANEDGISGLGL